MLSLTSENRLEIATLFNRGQKRSVIIQINDKVKYARLHNWTMIRIQKIWYIRTFKKGVTKLGFFSVPHLLWQGTPVYNGHLQGPMTLTHTCFRAFGSGAVTICFNHLNMSRPEFENPTFSTNTQPSASEENALTYCATAVDILY